MDMHVGGVPAPVEEEFGERQAASKIDRLFRPESVAIVGASPKGGIATEILKNIKKWGFSGRLVAVNPRYEQIEGVSCFPSLTAIPFPIGLAVVAVPSNAIPAVLHDCEVTGVRAIQIISSGFAEERGEGVAKQFQLAQWAERTGIPVVGPNCYGLLNGENRLIATPADFYSLSAGGVSAVVQSGTLMFSLVMPLLARGIGVGRVVTSGNEACLDVADFINYFADDKDTRVIACYCEQIKRPLEFIKACERAADKNKPIVMIKIGRSEAARKGALAHTGSVAGSDVAIDAVLKKLGVVRVDTVDDLIEAAAALSTTKRPRGRRIALASFSGTAVNILSDVAEPFGVEFPPPPAEARARLEAVLPEFGNVSNPLDLTSQADYDTHIIDESLKTLATCGTYDVVVWGRGAPSRLDMRSPVCQALKRAAEAAPDVVFSVMALAGGHFFAAPGPGSAMVEPAAEFDGMPFLQGVGPGLKALSALIGYAEFQRARKPGNRLSAHRGQRSACYAEAVRILREAKGDVLTEREGKHLLALYGIPVTREALATDAKQAARVAQDLGFPVAMKVESADIVHKTDVGGVALNISSSEQAAATFEQIVGSVRSRCPEANIAGALVQEMAKPGIEMMLGATFDPQFGPVIVFGLGGIWVEALKDVRALMPPFDAAEVKAELGRLRGASVLRGARGGAKPDLEAFADCIVKFSTLCSDLADEIGEIDVNPIILAASGTGLTAVDCLITRKAPQKV
ncbi:acetate--CoA ligase family protein [Bradyrhizobium diazoefficiens]|uniref:acetate--CoA ligase family protein n=1 Tax=Bradyrhizobium diazoefficiens TaxID=1355477 RepID=UPI00190960A9|nr:acetate--CoA ligase family protein [Bradyrhizobium diazoefficiens]QQO35555.1 acetate--CoA ligase family protein [Bradyrhizobium diazoefficiens]